jgi:hypothetical protein
LTWKYRQVDSGEWDVLEALGDERWAGGAGAAGACADAAGLGIDGGGPCDASKRQW